MFLFISFLVLLSLLLDWYAFQGVKSITGNRIIHWGYWIIFAGTSIALILSFLLADAASQGIPAFTQWMINSFITLFVTKLVFTVALLAEDIYRLTATAFSAYKKEGKEGTSMPERRKFISQAGLIIAGIPFASFIYGIAKGKYDYTVHRQVLYFDDLPEAFDGFTITQLSDIHSGSFGNADAVWLFRFDLCQ